jgi:hypothetical protein
MNICQQKEELPQTFTPCATIGNKEITDYQIIPIL